MEKRCLKSWRELPPTPEVAELGAPQRGRLPSGGPGRLFSPPSAGTCTGDSSPDLSVTLLLSVGAATKGRNVTGFYLRAQLMYRDSTTSTASAFSAFLWCSLKATFVQWGHNYNPTLGLDVSSWFYSFFVLYIFQPKPLQLTFTTLFPSEHIATQTRSW